MTINQDRLINTFLSLVQIDSPTGQEAAVAAELARRLRALDMEATVDAIGNVLGRWEGEGEFLLLCAHMDTVPGAEIKPVVQDGIIRSDGTTILGGDDKSGVAVILEVLAVLREQGRRPALEVVFTVQEEGGLYGAKAIDPTWLRSRQALVLDSGGPLNEIVNGAPGSDKITAVVHGRAAHAGAHPEAGINAILIAAKAIAKMPLGRIDEMTTANMGAIQGGQAVNIVPDRVEIHGETRSHDKAKLDAQTAIIRQAFEEAVAEYPGARLELDIDRTYESYQLDADLPLMQRIAAALKAMGEDGPVFKLTGGGSDANIFNARGLTALPISTGMSDVHTNQESIAIADMVKSAEFMLRII